MLKQILSFFTPYVHPLEKRSDRFFKKLTSTANPKKSHERLLALMQSNLAILNLWLEKKFKGYRHLNKSKRRELIKNLNLITKVFREYCENNSPNNDELSEQLLILGWGPEPEQKAKLAYIMQIMAFLKPGRYYEYREASSFDNLLANIEAGQKMIGDCNQIATLYLYFYALRYPLSDFKLKLIPGHIVLNLAGTDIETTNGTFHKYANYDLIVPVTEIITTNLLDIHDYRFERYELSERTLLKSAQLAYILSSKRELVTKNLQIAYRNLAIQANKKSDFVAALFFASKSTDEDLTKTLTHNAAVHHLKLEHFDRAYFFATKLSDSKLMLQIKTQQARSLLNKGDFLEARTIAQTLGNNALIKSSYRLEYQKLQKKVANLKTFSAQKKHKSTYKKLLILAEKMDEAKLTQQLKSLLEKL